MGQWAGFEGAKVTDRVQRGNDVGCGGGRGNGRTRVGGEWVGGPAETKDEKN